MLNYSVIQLYKDWNIKVKLIKTLELSAPEYILPFRMFI